MHNGYLPPDKTRWHKAHLSEQAPPARLSRIIPRDRRAKRPVGNTSGHRAGSASKEPTLAHRQAHARHLGFARLENGFARGPPPGKTIHRRSASQPGLPQIPQVPRSPLLTRRLIA